MSETPASPSLQPSASPVAEHLRPAQETGSAPAEHGPSYTAWHPLLAQVLVQTLASPAVEVYPFVKLGTLPLEADIILLRKQADIDLLALFPEFDFLLQFLKKYLIIEYKSPLDRLERADFDTIRAYAMLCKRKYNVVKGDEIAAVMLYSQLEEPFFATCAQNGYPFAEKGPGIWVCEGLPLRLYAINLTAYGAQHPDHPINLFSKRYRSYRPVDGRWQRLLGNIQQHVLGEMKAMHARLRGQQELDQTFEEWEEQYLASLPVEKRLRGLPPEDRLRGLSPEERRQLRELLERETAQKS